MVLRTKKLNVNIFQLSLVMYAIGIFMLKGYCYFRWDSYTNVFVKYIAIFLNYGSLLILFIISCKKYLNNIKKKKNISILLFSIILILYISFTGSGNFNYIVSDIELLMSIIILCILPNEKKQLLFKYIFIGFSIMILPSFIYYLLSVIGINLPHSVLLSTSEGKLLYGWYYNHYFMGLTTVQTGQLSRFCGIFDEAGFVGSIAALLLSAGYKRIDRRWYTLLLIEGIFTFSMAFYVLIFLFYLMNLFKDKSFKKIAIILGCAFGVYIILNINTSNPIINYLQSRVDLGSFFIVKDNRLTSTADHEISSFIANGGTQLIFGNGRDASNINSNILGYSYKFLLYDYGVLGTLMYIGYFIYCTIIKTKIKYSFPFLCVFIASIYQRPYVFTILYVSIFITSLSFINLKESEKTYGNVRKISS